MLKDRAEALQYLSPAAIKCIFCTEDDRSSGATETMKLPFRTELTLTSNLASGLSYRHTWM